MQLTLVLEHRGLMPYAEGSKPRPHPSPPSPSGKSTSGSGSGSGSTPTNQAAIDEWDKANRETLIQIVLTLQHEVAALVTGKSLASEAWTAVKSCFDGHGIQSVAYLMTKLWCSTMTLDRELLPQIQEVKECAQKLKSLGYEISDELQAIAIILSLPPEYETLQTILTTRDSPPTLDQTVYTIQAHELKQKRDQENVLLSTSRSLPRRQPSRPKLKVSEKKCVNCHLPGHTIEKCWSEGGGVEGQRPKHWGKPKPRNPKERTARVAHSPSPPPAIYVVRAEGEALKSQSSTSPTTFILDSGATAHMSHDWSYFSTYQKLVIPKTIRVADDRSVQAIGVGDIEVLTHLEGRTRPGTFKNVPKTCRRHSYEDWHPYDPRISGWGLIQASGRCTET